MTATAPARNWFLRRLEASVGRDPARTAVVAGTQRLSYRDLDERVAVLAGRLRAAGLGAGDRIGLHLENHAGFVVTWWAIWRLAAVAVPLSPRLRGGKWARLVADADLAAVLSQASLDAAWRGLFDAEPAGPVDAPAMRVGDPMTGADGRSAPGLPAHAKVRGPRILLIDETGRMTAALGRVMIDAGPGVPLDPPPADLAALLYTSGSSGVPKGVMHSQASMRAACRMVLPALGLRHEDVILCALPLSFSYGLYQVLMAGVIGATLVLERGMSFPAQLLLLAERERATVLPAVPTLIATLLGGRLPVAERLASVRLITSAGAPLPAAHAASLRSMCPQARLLPMYGLTECKRVSIAALDQPPEPVTDQVTEQAAAPPHAVEAGVGRGLPGQRLWLLDEDGRPMPSGADRPGELVVAGPHVMHGYWRRPAETAAALRPGAAYGLPGETLLFTGDLFRERPGGWLAFVARRDDLIKSGGEKVSPREVEEVLHTLPGVAEALVLGAPDPIQGQKVVAQVVRSADDAGASLEARAVIRHCQRHLEGASVPREVIFVDSLPRTDSGKASRREAALARVVSAAGLAAIATSPDAIEAPASPAALVPTSIAQIPPPASSSKGASY